MCQCFFKCLKPPLSPNALQDETFALTIAYYNNHGRTTSTCKVALLYGLDQTILVRRINRKIQSSRYSRQNRILSSTQESAILQYIDQQYRIRFPCTMEMITEAALYF